MDITTTLRMVEATFGFSNCLHDHVERTQQMQIDSRNVDKMFINKLDNGFVPPSVITEVAEQSAGITAQAQGISYIEGGWGNARGICKLVFVAEENITEVKKVVMVCYMYGGNADAQAGITPDTVVVPVKTWILSTRQATDPVQGLPVEKTFFVNGNNVLLDNPSDPSNRGMVSLRPSDIVTTSQIIEYQRSQQADDMPFGHDANYASGNALLKTQGMILSSSNNDSIVNHAQKLLEASVRYNHNIACNSLDPLTAISDASGMPTLRECATDSNPVFSYLQHQCGITYIGGFTGYTVGQLTMVFPELTQPGFANVEMLDASRFTVGHDSRAETKEFGTTSYYEILATEMYNIVLSELFARRLSAVNFSATNNVTPDMAHLAINNVIVVSGIFTPLLDEDLEAPTNVEIFKQSIVNQFFSRFDPYNSGMPQQLVSVVCEANLLGVTRITIYLNGDETNGYQYAFGAFASNRNNLNVGQLSVATDTAIQMFTNLNSHFTR